MVNQTDSLDSSWVDLGTEENREITRARSDSCAEEELKIVKNESEEEVDNEEQHNSGVEDQGSSTETKLQFQLAQFLLNKVKARKNATEANSGNQAYKDLHRMNFVINGQGIDQNFTNQLYEKYDSLIENNGNRNYRPFAKKVFEEMFKFAKAEAPSDSLMEELTTHCNQAGYDGSLFLQLYHIFAKHEMLCFNPNDRKMSIVCNNSNSLDVRHCTSIPIHDEQNTSKKICRLSTVIEFTLKFQNDKVNYENGKVTLIIPEQLKSYEDRGLLDSINENFQDDERSQNSKLGSQQSRKNTVDKGKDLVHNEETSIGKSASSNCMGSRVYTGSQDVKSEECINSEGQLLSGVVSSSSQEDQRVLPSPLSESSTNGVEGSGSSFNAVVTPSNNDSTDDGNAIDSQEIAVSNNDKGVCPSNSDASAPKGSSRDLQAGVSHPVHNGEQSADLSSGGVIAGKMGNTRSLQGCGGNIIKNNEKNLESKSTGNQDAGAATQLANSDNFSALDDNIGKGDTTSKQVLSVAGENCCSYPSGPTIQNQRDSLNSNKFANPTDPMTANECGSSATSTEVGGDNAAEKGRLRLVQQSITDSGERPVSLSENRKVEESVAGEANNPVVLSATSNSNHNDKVVTKDIKASNLGQESIELPTLVDVDSENNTKSCNLANSGSSSVDSEPENKSVQQVSQKDATAPLVDNNHQPALMPSLAKGGSSVVSAECQSDDEFFDAEDDSKNVSVISTLATSTTVSNNKETEQKNNIQANSWQSTIQSNGSTTVTLSVQKSKLPTVATWMLTIAGVLAGTAAPVAYFAFSGSLLTAGITAGVGACCLVAAAIVYYCNKPSRSLENSNAEMVTSEEIRTSCCV